MEKFSATSKLVSAGAILVLGMGISGAVMTSSANAAETHSIHKVAHISQSSRSGSIIPPAVLPSHIKAPSISGIGSGEDSEGSALGSSEGDDSEGDSSASTGVSISSSDN